MKMNKTFSLGVGSPLFHFLAKHFFPQQSSFIYTRRMAIAVLLTWLPLLILSLVDGATLSGAQILFIYDVDTQVRFLLVVPLLLQAEMIAHERIPIIVNKFLKDDIIAFEERARFEKNIAWLSRLKDSVLVDVILIGLAYTLGHWVSINYLPLGVSSWFAANKGVGTQWTLAGYWYLFFSLPFFQYILLRWYFRIIVWYLFLWRTSRLSLKLNSLHPDRAGGLGFLSFSIYALAPFLLTHSVLLFSMIFNRIWNTGAVLYDFQIETFGILVFVFIIPLFPLLFFTFQMVNEKRIGTLNYTDVASRYVNDFRQKWISPHAKNQSSLLGASDIQSLADLFNSFEVSNKMGIVPFNKSSLLSLVLLLVLPLLPLVLTLIPLEKMISQMFRLIF